ncbi:hypothetical protein McpSp1_09160 [Methanocorpusculaceae archaeon Sp1]|nr:hypothetical protein [Methanocorpusculaceae archaeon Sp1]
MIFLVFAALLGFLLGCLIMGALILRHNLKETYNNEHLLHVMMRNIDLSLRVQELEEKEKMEKP